MTLSIGNAWGTDEVLFSTDFSDASWSGKTFSQGNTETADVINGITFYAKNSDAAKNFSISEGKLIWPNNNIASSNYFLGIPVSNVNGTITVTVQMVGVSGKKANVKYVISDGAASVATPGGTGTQATAASNGTGTITITSATLSNVNKKAVVYLGRYNGNTENNNVQSITITTPAAPSCSTPADPTGLSVGSITADGATFTITDGANTNNYEIVCKTSSTTPAADATPTKTGTSKTLAVTGLDEGTTYYAWVRSVCDASHKSDWVALGSTFTTKSCTISSCGNASLTYVIKVGSSGSQETDGSDFITSATPSNSTALGASTAVGLSTITITDGTLKAAAAVSACYPSKPNMTGKIGVYNGTSYSSSNYLQFAFTVKSGYTFTPCDIRFVVQPVDQATSFRWEVTDGTNIYGYGAETDVPKGGDGGASVLMGLTSTAEMAAGDYYIRLYPYTNAASKTFRLGTDVVLRGTTAEAAAPSCTDVVAPTGLAENTEARTTEKITFTWTAATNASSYDVKLWDNSACTGDPIATDNVTTTSKQFTGLTDGTTYYCKVQSKGDGETYCTDGGTTDAVSGTTATIPSYNVSAVTSTGDNSRGSVSAAASSVKMGATTTITAVPTTGYRVSAWTVTGTGAIISPNGLSNSTTTTLTMGTSDVTVTVSFEEIPCIGNEGGTLFSASTSATGDISIDESAENLELNFETHKTTVSGGKMYVYNGQTSSKKLITADGFSITNGNTYFHIQLDCALEAGDTISVKVGKNADERGVWISSTRTDNTPGSAPACALTTTETGSGLKAVTYTVTGSDEYHGKKDFYIYRATSNGTYFNNVKITRPAKYAMTFAKGDEDASGTMDAQSVIEKSLVTLPACTFTAPEGKEFDAWVVTKTAGGAAVSVTDGKFTMPQEAVTVTATWKALTVKYAVTYVLNGPSGDAPTETNKEAGAEFTLADAPTWADHVFEGWQWTDDKSATHLEDAEAEFTMPAYAVTFTAQWRLDPQATMSNAQYVIGGSALNMAAKFSSLNTSGAVIFSLKESYAGASITPAGSFTATVAGEYIVVAEQAGDGTYAKGEAEATVEVLESELSDIFIFSKNSDYGGDDKCLSASQANTDDGEHLYTSVSFEGFTKMGRATSNNTECILTFSVKNAYNSLFAIKSICTYGKFEEPAGGQISWDGGSNWEDLAKYTTQAKKEFAPAAGAYPTSFKIKFMGVSKDAGGLWWRNALVTLEAKKAIVSTVIDLTDVKINSTSISAANLSTLKTGPAYALNLADEYVTAPTVKFNKHTVITYDDESEVETDDIITETAAVNVSGKWEASAEIDDITYTVTMAKAEAFVVHYYESDGETLIGSENVAVSGHPTAAGITPTPIDYKLVVWTFSGEPVDLDDVTSAVAGTEITLVASYVDAYARSINIEQWVLDNNKNNSAFRAVLDARYYKYANLNDLDSLTAEKNDGDRNYPFLGQKWKLATSEISFLLKEGSTVKARFGNMGSSVNVKIGSADAVELTSGSYANTSVSSSKEYSYTATEDVVVKFQGTGTGTVVFKQIMIDEAIASVTLPAIVTYDANGGSFGKTSEKYTGTPLVIGDATPADEDYEFEGWHVGTVDGTKIDASAYAPTKNVTLVAKYVAKPSPFSLSTLTYKIGTGSATAVGYVEGTYEYDVELPYAPSYETITVAYTLADGTSSEKAGAVLSVTNVPGAATFTIVAANTTEKTYTVNFKKEAKDGLEIIGATVSTNTTADMSGLYGGTASVNLSSKKIDNGGYIYITLPSGYTFEETDVLVVNVNTKADIGTKALEITTGVGNIDGEVWKTIAFDDYSTGNNTIALTGIVANQTSIGLKRSSNQNAKINSLKVYRPMNPVLKSITFDGTKIDVTGLTAGETLPYSADLTSVTPEIFWNGAGTATVTTNAGAWAWGDNTYVLTDKDGDATTYTITLTRATRSSDKSLSSLTVDGNAIALSDGVYDYTYVYPYGTDPATVPVVAAEANDAHASVGTITQAASTAGTASFAVTAEDETEQEYTVSFKISRVPGLVIYDGSTMTDIAAKTGSDPTGFSWSMGSSVASDGSNVAGTWQGKNYEHAIKGFKANASASNTVSFTVPTGYLAKIRLVGSTNSDGNERKMFIAEEATNDASKAIGNYVITSSTYEAQGFVTELLMPGTYYLGSTDSYRLFEFSAQLYPIDYSRNVTDGRLGTICLQKGGTMVGAAVYEVAYFNPDNRKIYFDEVLSGEMEPGMPYIFLPDQGNNDQLVVTYGNNAPAAVAGHHNGLYGSFSEALLAKDEDNYILQSNKYWYVNSDEVYVGENRAYLKVEEIIGYAGEPEPAPAQGRRRVSMSLSGQNTATGLDQITNDQSPITNKVLINGQLFILRGEKLYDATGRLVK